MISSWLIEIAKAIGKFFLNPLFYWGILLVVIAGYRRIKKERIFFGSRVFDIFSEWKNTWILSILSGLLISAILLGVGIVFSYETIITLIIIAIILSITMRYTMLSVSYTIGLTYLLLLFLPYLWDEQTYFNYNLFSNINYAGIAILLGLFLSVEAILISKSKRNETCPSLVKGKRGNWIGQHHIKKLSLIPVFLLVPTGMLTPIEPYWPFFPLGEETYSIVLFPFLIGFDYKVTSDLPVIVSKRLGKGILVLGIVVLLLAVGSIYIPWLSLVAVLVAILGREIINYRERMKNKKEQPYFFQDDNGLKVLGIIPHTPAARLDILVGEKILKVNGYPVKTTYDFYRALQNRGSFFKMTVLDDNGEIRFIQSAFYEGDHHKLGLIFTTEPYREK
ncbi:MAG TPA: PDZ domain-containing protein [Candidatus Avamphibacillus sp.]|nr:PDZ domain-containing protein [Candidatus Avamphibacillus sp.]